MTLRSELEEFLTDRTALGGHAPGIAGSLARRLIEAGWVTAAPAMPDLDADDRLVLAVLSEWPRPHTATELVERRRLFSFSAPQMRRICARLYERGLVDCEAPFAGSRKGYSINSAGRDALAQSEGIRS